MEEYGWTDKWLYGRVWSDGQLTQQIHPPTHDGVIRREF
jgi:hypothetical protein